MTRVPITTCEHVEDCAAWFPRLRPMGYRNFEVQITADNKWLILGIKYDHLVEKQPKKQKT